MLGQVIPFLSQYITSVLILVAAVQILYLYWRRFQAHRDLPPGPTGYPILGVIPKLGKQPQLTVQAW